MSREDFSPATKTILAQRAGYQCSHPDCDLVTIGPGDGREEVSSIGEAAHIYSASKKGPRGQGGLTPEELRGIENGIWMCKTHARLVDTNGGRGFTTHQLISWKNLHEEKIKKLQGRLHRKLGWVSKLVVGNNPIFNIPAIIDLGKVTYIEGERNGAGKTAICEWISSLSGLNRLERWLKSRLNFSVEFFNPDKQRMDLSISDGDAAIKLNSKSVPFNPLPVHVEYLLGSEWQDKIQKFSLPEAICQFFNLDRVSLNNLIGEVGKNSYSLASNIKFKWEMPEEGAGFQKREIIVCDIKGTASGLGFFSLSDGQQQILMVELAIAKAQMLSQYTPVILIMELENLSFDSEVLHHYFNYFMSAETSFQTVVTSLGHRKILKWEGWSRYKLEGAAHAVNIVSF